MNLYNISIMNLSNSTSELPPFLTASYNGEKVLYRLAETPKVLGRAQVYTPWGHYVDSMESRRQEAEMYPILLFPAILDEGELTEVAQRLELDLRLREELPLAIHILDEYPLDSFFSVTPVVNLPVDAHTLESFLNGLPLSPQSSAHMLLVSIEGLKARTVGE